MAQFWGQNHKPNSGIRPDDSACTARQDIEANNINDNANDYRKGGVCYMYAKILARFWYVICLLVIMIVAAFTAVTLTLYPLPDFSNPAKGFDARGTLKSARVNSLRNLFDDSDDLLVFRPADAGRSPDQPVRQERAAQQPRTKRHTDQATTTGIRFCSPLWQTPQSTDLGTLVFEGVDGSNMLTAEAIKSVCKAEEGFVTSHPSYPENCLCTDARGDCPSSWSLGNYVALLSNKTSYTEIEDIDVRDTVSLLLRCAPFFRNTTAEDMQKDTIPNAIPDECKQHEYAAFTMLHYLLPAEVGRGVTESSTSLKSSITAVLLPIRDRDAQEKIFQESIQQKPATDGITRLRAVDMPIKFSLFASAILFDSLFFGIAAAAIFLLIWIYTGSILVTLAALLNMVFSFALADFFFTVAFVRPFFPFVNIISVILLLGIGADDTFVYMDLWKKCRSEFGDQDLVRLVHETLRHASATMFVTSFTTAAALFATALSEIVVVKCFAVFAGTAILMNLGLTLSLLPAVIVMQHKLTAWCCSSTTSEDQSTGKCSCCLTKLLTPLTKFHEIVIPFLVKKLRFLWIVLFLLLLAGSAVVIFCIPGFQLPSSSDLQYFINSHYLEQYDLVYKDQFAYNKDRVGDFVGWVVWGVHSVDNGNWWDPDDRGTLILDDSFTFSSPEDQTWLRNFCRDMREQSFHTSFEGENCIIENFIGFMERPACNIFGQDVSPCCNQSVFPYEPDLFKICLAKFADVFQSPSLFFLRTSGQLAGIKINFQTTFKDSLKFVDNDKLWTTIDTWIGEKIKSAPESLQRGWFSSHHYQLSFYDLQLSLAAGTRTSMLVTLAVASGILFLTIQNIILTLWAMLTITSAVFVTVASLVLLGWELNVVEATIITLAVGLSVDFTIHYGVAYKLSRHPDRIDRSLYSLKTMSPAITIAAFSTFVAGALVSPSTLQSYYQFGVFLMLVMSISWTHGTFFFQSLCMVAGPQGSCGDIPCPACCECCRVGSRPAEARSVSPTPGRITESQGHDNPVGASIRADEGIYTVTNGWIIAQGNDRLPGGK